MLHRAIRFAILCLVELFYPRIEIRGRERVPESGPVIFVLNHPNGLLDPLLLMVQIRRPISFLAKSTFFANPLGRLCMDAFGALPVFRQRDRGLAGGPRGNSLASNETTFARCRGLLRQQKALALFPEGTTHSETRLLPLRTGAARIALGAAAEADWQLDVRIVPVGLWYQRKTQFRSAALLVVGEPFGLAEYAATYAAQPRQAVQALTERIGASLATVVLQAENAELLTGMPMIAAWTTPGGPPLSLTQQHERAATLLAAYRRLVATDPGRAAALAQQARRYVRTLRTLGIDDPWDLELPAARPRRIIRQIMFLLLSLPLALAGSILSYGPYRLSGFVSPPMVGRHDTLLGTGKLIVGSALVLLGWLLAAILVGFFWGWLAAMLLFLAAPLLAYCALRWGEAWRELREALESNWIRARHRTLAQNLIARRQALAAQIVEALQVAASPSPEMLSEPPIVAAQRPEAA
ncbi:MAG TPA: lysophospholipid acyltransferase family protein [Herpetosiphonaceae bacterium]